MIGLTETGFLRQHAGMQPGLLLGVVGGGGWHKALVVGGGGGGLVQGLGSWPGGGGVQPPKKIFGLN